MAASMNLLTRTLARFRSVTCLSIQHGSMRKPQIICSAFPNSLNSCKHLSTQQLHKPTFLNNHISKNSCSLFRNISFKLDSPYANKNRYLVFEISRNFSTTDVNLFKKGSPPTKGGQQKDHSNLLAYCLATIIWALGMAFAGVPLYKMFCGALGLGGKATVGHDTSMVENMEITDRVITVKFKADKDGLMKWNFRPQQKQVVVKVGETALAFYTAENPTDKPITGISTYNITPVDAGLYFNKIQCFCFEEQRLNPGEQVDMPVFFFLDPEFDEDPTLEYCKEVILYYHFFESKDGLELPLPGFMKPKPNPIHL